MRQVCTKKVQKDKRHPSEGRPIKTIHSRKIKKDQDDVNVQNYRFAAHSAD